MDAAKAAVSKFAGRHGHTTEVEERVNAPVVNETISPTRHENITEAVDREVHQDHYHTTVQPLQDQQVLPEKHSHNVIPVEEREFHHGNESETRERLQMEAAKFKDTSRTHETQHTQSALPTATGEHVHHHVHETVQPIVHKEVIQPEVVHTTVPIHETHHADTQHHGTSVLPMKNLSEFGNPSTTGTRHEEYDGVPRSYNKAMQQEQTDADINPYNKGVDGPTSHHTGGTELSGTEPFRDDGHMVHGKGASAGGYGTEGTPSTGYSGRDTGLTGQQSGMSGRETGMTGQQSGMSGRETGMTGQQSGMSGRETGMTGQQSGTTGASGTDGLPSGTSQGYGNSGTSGMGSKFGDMEGRDNTSSGTSTGKKPSLMDKLNPKIDSNGDGKAGFMK